LKKIISLLSLLSSLTYADSLSDIAKKAHLASINTLLIFTSQDALSSGTYHFTDVGVDMDILHLPFTYHFPSTDSLNYFIVGNIGYSKTYITQTIQIPDGTRLNNKNHIRTYTAGLGGGIQYKFSPQFYISGGAELIYSKSGVSVLDPNNNIGDAIEDFFNQDYNDNLSYKFFTLAEYNMLIFNNKAYAKIAYKIYETKSTFDLSELSKFTSESSVTTLTLGVETDKLFENSLNYLTLEPYVNANYLNGAVKNSVKFDYYATLGVVAYWYTPKAPWWAQRFFLEASTVKSDGLDGYNIGLGFTLDF